MPASITYRGKTFTSTGAPRFKETEGLIGRTSTVEASPLAGAHGGVPLVGWDEPKEFLVVLQLIGTDGTPDALWTQMTALIEAFRSDSEDEDALVLDWPGWPEMQIACRPVSEEPELSVLSPLYPVRLLASDPRLYSTTLRSTQIPVFAGSGGLSYDVDYPKDYGSAGEGLSVEVPNEGFRETWPRIVISGPASGTVQPISIENLTDGTSITFTAGGGLTIPAGSTLVVDTHPARRVVRFTDGANRWNTVAGTTWWPIQPGGAELRFRATGTTTGVTAVVESRDAYL